MEQSTAEVKQDAEPVETKIELPEQDGSVESAAAALSALAGIEDESSEAAPEGQTESQEAPAKEEVKQEAEEAAPAQLSLKIGDKEYSVPIPADMPEEVQQLVKDGLLMRADYTRKTQEVAEGRKAIEARAQEFDRAAQVLNLLPSHLAAISNVDAQLQALQNPEYWQRLQAADPTGIQTIQAKQAFQDLVNQRQMLYGELNRAHQHVEAVAAKQIQERMQAALPKVKEAIPNYGEAVAKEMTAFAKSHGITDEQLNTIYDAAPLILLYKAMEYDKLQSQQAVTSKKVEKLPPKVQRSGTASDPNNGPSMNQAAYQRLRNSGSVDDAAAVINSLLG